MPTLKDLRNFSSEIGCELIYMIGRSKTNFEKLTYGNFNPRKNIGLAKDGKLYLLPVKPDQLLRKLSRAVTRQRKKTVKD